MKKNAMLSLSAFVPILAMLASCATMETKLEKPETDYNKYTIVTSHNILKPGVRIDEYSLSFEKSISKETDLLSINLLNLIFKDGSTLSGGRYAFLKGSEKLCDVYIFQKSNIKKSGEQSMGSVSRYIDIVRKGDIKEYEVVDRLGSDAFLSVKENNVPIDIGYYREPGNKLGGLISTSTGYKISINGKPYGIIAFYRTPALYELKAAAGDAALKDAVMLWTLAAYQERSQQSSR